MNAANRSKWFDKEYMDHVERLANLFYNSQLVSEDIRSDKATITALIVKSDAWGVHPDTVLGSTFKDQFGGLAHTGKLYKLILQNHNEIRSLSIKQIGDWSLVDGQYTIAAGPTAPVGDARAQSDGAKWYVPKWTKEQEDGLGIKVTVSFINNEKSPLEKRIMLSDIDYTQRMNFTWVTMPSKRVEYLALRDLCYGELFHYINGMDMQDNEDLFAEKSVVTHSVITTTNNTVSKSDKSETQPLSSTVETTKGLELDVPLIEPAVKMTGKQVIDKCLSIQDQMIEAQSLGRKDRIEELKQEIISIVKSLGSLNLNKAQVGQVQHIYNTINSVVSNVDPEVFSG
ncbi:hypothetical protein [Vibrio sp. Hal054]|uniref:hypothetical protein n=1 Tax=Vibrio sp. Hal054 TaxID=3035158 RepID=UPI00301E082B